ncbi:MAG: succinate dehydrogenase/fumarate reductase iron-sulfur subunit [Candidatus Hodarchaeales archaeon]|jgi:succinate dehydrogenase / fumarate reductase iron-sulfur subunit
MMEKKVFVIYRKNSNEDIPRYVRYEVPVTPGMSVLDALFYIQDHLDTSLAFRYACRGAICGSCGMTIDKYPRLACRTQVSRVKSEKKPKLPELIFGNVDWDEDNEILIEPLPNMGVINDLVVDMESFWKFYEDVQPFFTREWRDIAPESEQSPDNAKSIEHLVYCILCGLCWTCPVSGKNKRYLGPATLAKSYRFVADTRLSENQGKIIRDRITLEDGVPACEKIYTCNRVCPKGVRPGTAIKSLREL